MKTENYISKLEYLSIYAQNELRKEDIFQQTPSGELSTSGSSFCANCSEVEFLMFSQQVEKFGDHLLLKKGLGEITREGHKRSISIVLKKFDKEELEHEEFQQHILWMHSQKYSHSHITNTIKAIEYFTEYNNNPLQIAKTRRPKTLIKEYLTEAEINCMIRCSRDIREKAMLTLLAYSGIRNREFCNLKVEDVDFGNNQIIIRDGKYSKDRRVNIGAACSNVLVDYIMECRKQKQEFLFTTLAKNNQYQSCDLRKLAKTIAKRARIEKNVYPHLFRHALATNMLKRGANIMLIQDQLGHADITTTVEYITRLPYKMKTEYEHYAPAYL